MSDWFNKADYKIDGHWYHVPALAAWAKNNLPVVRVSIAELMDRLDAADRLFIQVEEGEWTQRCDEVDLGYPVLLLIRGDGLELIDGNHRTWKAWRLGLETIDAHVFENMPSPTDLAQSLRSSVGPFNSVWGYLENVEGITSNGPMVANSREGLSDIGTEVTGNAVFLGTQT